MMGSVVLIILGGAAVVYLLLRALDWQSTQQEISILHVLEAGEAHGIEIHRRLRARGIRVFLGAMYMVLWRLESQGRITSRWGETTPARQGLRRRYYRLIDGTEGEP